MKTAFIIFLLFITATVVGQSYVDEFEEGKILFKNGKYYEAYLRFNAAYVISRNEKNTSFAKKSLNFSNQASLKLHEQQRTTNNLLQIKQNIINSFYFYDNRLALAVDDIYGDLKYGFINKKGEIIIDFKYDKATSFDNNTGCAKVERNGNVYWLSALGKEYSYNKNINTLPQIIKTNEVFLHENVNKKNIQLDNFFIVAGSKKFKFINANNDYDKEITNGVELYNTGKYYDAFLCFNAASVLASNDNNALTALLSEQLKDTAVFEIKRFSNIAENTIKTSQKIIDAFYFYNGKFALAFKDGKYGFINKQGNTVIEYKYDNAISFDRETGLAKVVRNNQKFLIADL